MTRDRQEQASVYTYTQPNLPSLYVYGGVIYGNCHACTRQTNKITRHWRREKHEDAPLL
jgi:hypothetical protein